MGSLKILALAGAMAIGTSAVASAADLAYPPPPAPEPLGLKGSIGGGWYLRGDVGVGIQEYDKIDVRSNGASPLSTATVTSFQTTNSKGSFASFAGVGLGYQFNNYLRFDVTGEYRGTSVTGRDYLSHNGFGSGIPGEQTNSYRGDLATFVGLANAYIDLGTWNCLTPYLGAGIGVARHTMNGLSDNGIVRSNGVDVGTSYGFADSATKTTVAWALMAGVAYDVTSNLKLEFGYRYLNLGDAPVMGLRGGTGGLLSNPSSSVRFKEIDSHDFRIGMRWNFSDPSCCGPVEKPIAYAPAPVVRKY